MYTTVRKINEFFKNANKADVDKILSAVLFTERQQNVFDMYYIKKKDVGFIADTFCCSQVVVYKELQIIRNKIAKLL